YIAEQESVEEIEDETNWIKSNPILEVEGLRNQVLGYLRDRLAEAKEKGNMNGVLVKNFNMWRQSSEESYIDKQTWDLAKIDKPDTHKRRVRS
ncbi:UNVERIFIED_CONTAM: phage terminase family protein, partial [Bacteroidetes bacterium 56_B9]